MAKIHVADDDQFVQDLLRLSLEKDGHQVMETTTGPETLRKLKEGPADLLVLDVMLPGMDGHTILLEMAKDERTANVPVVVLTALHTTKNMFAKFSQVKSFVLKPFEPAEISSVLKKVLAK